MWVRCFLAYTRLHWHWMTYSRAKLEDEDKIYNSEIRVACNSWTRLTVVWLGQLCFSSLVPRPLPDFILTFSASLPTSYMYMYVPRVKTMPPNQFLLPTIQFLIACSMLKQRGEAWYILSRDWCQCLPRYTEGGRGGGRGRGGQSWKNQLGLYLVVSALSAGVSNVCEAKTCCFWFKTKNTCANTSLSTWVDTDVIRDKIYQAFPLHLLHTASNQKLDGRKASWEQG